MVLGYAQVKPWYQPQCISLQGGGANNVSLAFKKNILTLHTLQISFKLSWGCFSYTHPEPLLYHLPFEVSLFSQ